MTLEEFISLDPAKIRRDKDLMQLFVSFYKAAFSLTPNCAGCVFTKGFNKLKRYALKGEKKINFTKSNDMEDINFVLKKQYRLKILTYRENGITYRSYGYNLDSYFASKLVEHGKSEVFATLPKSKKEEVKEVDFTNNLKQVGNWDYDSMDWKEDILPLYAELKEKTGKKAVSRSKKDVIDFINENK